MRRLSDFVGNTPLLKITDKIYAKYEKFNPTASVKDRTMIGILNDAEKKGLLKKGDTIVEVSSGNAGISLAMLGAERDYRVKIIVPENIIEAKKEKIRKFGADLIEVPFDDYELGRKIRNSLVEKYGWFTPNQHFNPINIDSQKNIGIEILQQIKNININIGAIIIGAGTGGTIMGVNSVLKSKFPKMKTIAVTPIIEETFNTNVKYGLNGIGHSEQFLLDKKEIDEFIEVTYKQAEEGVLTLASNNGIDCGIISGANYFASLQWTKQNNINGIVITIISD